MILSRRCRARSFSTPLQILSASFLLATTTPSSSGDDLDELRASFEARTAEVSRPVKERFVRELAKLEKLLAAKNDFAGAIKVRDHRYRVEEELGMRGSSTPLASKGSGSESAANGGTPSTEPPADLDGPREIVLQLADARLRGDVQFDSAENALGVWKTPADSAEWEVSLRPGGYEVVVEYASGASTAGALLFKEARFHMTRTMEPTGGWSVFKDVNLGTLKITARSNSLTLSVAAPSSDGIAKLRAIKLVSARP